MMNCRQATCLISESQDWSLSLTEKMGLEVHVKMCLGCENFSQQVSFISQAMRAYANGLDAYISEKDQN